MNATTAKDRIIVALDVPTLEEAEVLVRDLAPYVGCFKVGLQLLMSVGAPRIVEFIHRCGGKVFLDGKFNDIPNTVGAASKAVSDMGVHMFNVHASSGVDAMQAAVANKGSSLVLAVTVLTSIDDPTSAMIFGELSWRKVLQFAMDAHLVGCDGVVCSPKELEILGRYDETKSLLKITPGVRPTWASTDDQERVTTPSEAIRAGATALVIGRPITKPPAEIGSPVNAAIRIAEEIETALSIL